MPHNHQGYDFICNHGKKIDVKSSCILKNNQGWNFNINKNTITDYFLCIAFDNRHDLNPLHVWMMPSDKVKTKTSIGISKSTIGKWAEFELDISKTLMCCNTLKQ